MKRLFVIVGIVFLSITLVGCGSSGGGSSSKFNPPAWIHGEWSDEFGMNHYTFTSDNIVLTGDGVSVNFKEVYKNVSIKETKSDTLYKINFPDGEYIYEKDTDSTLNLTITASGITVGPFPLIKK